MRKKKRKIASFGIPAMVCFALAAVLLAGGMVGSTRAALNVYSSQYSSSIDFDSIGVALYEGDKLISSQRYTGNGNWAGEEEGTLLSSLDEEVKIGETYTEELTVQNVGTIPVYVRAYVYRYWTGEKEKDVSLDPELIKLEFGNGWILDETTETNERQVWYYTNPLAVGAASGALVETICISENVNAVATAADGGLNYLYDGKDFNLEVEVDALQAENFVDAAASAWAKTVSVRSDGTLLDVK